FSRHSYPRAVDSCPTRRSSDLKAMSRRSLFAKKPNVMICVPSGITMVEERAVVDATKQAGAKEAYPIAEPFAAAIGAGLPVWEPDRKSTRLNSSHVSISYAVFC